MTLQLAFSPMTLQHALVALACLAMALVLLPYPRWQALILRVMSFLLRLTALVAIVGTAAIYVLDESVWTPWFAPLEGVRRQDVLGATALLVAVGFPIVTFLDFSARLDVATRTANALVHGMRSTGLLLQDWLDQTQSPGASVSPQRAREIRTALDAFHPTKPAEAKRPARATLETLLK